MRRKPPAQSVSLRVFSSRLTVGIVLVVPLLLRAAAADAAAEGPRRLTWRTLPAVGAAAFDAGPGAAAAMEIGGFARAQARAPSMVQSVVVQTQNDFGRAAGRTRWGESVTQGFLTLAAGRWQARLGAWLADERAAGDAERAAARTAYIDELARLYGEWWVAHRMAEHVGAFAADLDRALTPLREAHAAGRVSRLDLLDLESEAATLAVEYEAYKRLETVAAGAVGVLTAGTAAPDADEPHDEHDERPSADLPNPWRALTAFVAAHPRIVALARRSLALRDEAAWVESVAAPVLVMPGVGFHREPTRDLWGQVLLNVQMPTTNPSAPQREILTARADAEDVRRLWEVRVLGAALDALAADFDARARGLAHIAATLVQPLDERWRLLAAERAAGRVPWDRVVRARRALHDAMHTLTLAAAELHAHEARATVWRFGWLDATTP